LYLSIALVVVGVTLSAIGGPPSIDFRGIPNPSPGGSLGVWGAFVVFVGLTLLVLTPVFKDLPEAVLAALIIHAVSHLMKVKEFRSYYHERRIEFWLGLATLVGVITIDVLPGLVIGVVAMLLLVVYHASRPHLGVLGRVPGVPGAYGDVGRHPDYQAVPGLLVLRLEAPLFYANASLVRDNVKEIVGSSETIPRAVVLDLGANPDLDITSAEMLEQLRDSLQDAGIDLALAEIRQPVLGRMRKTHLLEKIGQHHVFRTVDEAVRTIQACGISSSYE